MKKLLIAFLLVLLPSICLAVPVTITAKATWNQNETGGNVDGWILSYGETNNAEGQTEQFARSQATNTGGDAWQITRSVTEDLPAGTTTTVYFKLRAFKGSTQSDWSNIASATITIPETPPVVQPPGNMQINVTVTIVQQ